MNAPEEVEESDGFDNHPEERVLDEDENDAQEETERCRATPVSLRPL